MKTKPINQKIRKNPKATQASDAIDPVMRSIIAQYPSMAAENALACAKQVYARRTWKPGDMTTIDQVTQAVVTKFATGFNKNCGGGVFVEGREHAMALQLLSIWSKSENELEVAKFIKLLKQMKKAYEEATELLSETEKKKGTKTKTNRG